MEERKLRDLFMALGIIAWEIGKNLYLKSRLAYLKTKYYLQVVWENYKSLR